jgi:VanZ family protein
VFKTLRTSHLLVLLLLALTPLFFVGGPSAIALPVIRYGWNLGHILFFFLATGLYCHLRPITGWQQLSQVLVSILAVSLLIELIQSQVGREFSSQDMLRNLVGSTLALFWRARPHLHPSLISFAVLLVLLDLSGFAWTAHTDWRIQRQAPLIEDFEGTAALPYWQGAIKQSQDLVIAGRYSGQAALRAGAFSGVSLAPILANWTGYTGLEMQVHNPGNRQLMLTIRINDRAHELSAQDYADRYNHSIALTPGWNKIVVPLSQVQSAPATRAMAMDQIYRLSLFFAQLDQPMRLTLDDIRLSSNQP